MSEKAAVAAEKVEGLRSSLPTPEDARGLVTAARRKAKAATVAVDASPNPYVATAAAYVGVKPSSLIGGGLTLAAVALWAYAGAGRRTRDDAGYAAFDREAGREKTDRGRNGGAGRERQRAVLEKQLAADRDAQRARWRSAMDDGSAAAASSETAAEDERRRLERIRQMNRASGDATAAAEAKLREARDRNEKENAAKTDPSSSAAASQPATAMTSAADRRRAERKARAEAAVLSEYQTAEDELDAGWDAEEVKEMSKKYKAFLKESKAKKWWGGGD